MSRGHVAGLVGLKVFRIRSRCGTFSKLSTIYPALQAWVPLARLFSTSHIRRADPHGLIAWLFLFLTLIIMPFDGEEHARA